MEKTLISIIVPVYKAEVYLRRCLNSILNQSFQEWETILVDDGSPDSSGEICNEYVNKDCRFRVIHQKNGGVASAREAGMLLATGKYSIHIDPDDWIDFLTLEVLYNKAKITNADMVVCDLSLEYKTRTVISCQQVESSETFLHQLFLQERHGSLCNKLIRTDLYKQYDLHFPKGMICWEDLYICCNILLAHPCVISYVPKAFYHYDFFSNPNSMVRKPSTSTLDSMIYFCEYFDNILPNKVWLNETKGMILATAYRYQLLTADEIRHLFPEINNWYISKYLYDYSHALYCGVAQVLNGKSMNYALGFQKLNQLYHRFFNKAKKILKL